MSSITDTLIDTLTKSEDFIDKLFANEYFCNKIIKLIDNKTKFNGVNLENVLWIDKANYEFIISYEEFIEELSKSDIKKLYQLNDFNLYKHYIKQSCLEGEIEPYHLVDTYEYKIVEIFNELIKSNQIISNVFELYNADLTIAYILIEKYYPKYLNLAQICELSGTETIDEFYNKIPNNYKLRKLFNRKDILVKEITIK